MNSTILAPVDLKMSNSQVTPGGSVFSSILKVHFSAADFLSAPGMALKSLTFICSGSKGSFDVKFKVSSDKLPDSSSACTL